MNSDTQTRRKPRPEIDWDLVPQIDTFAAQERYRDRKQAVNALILLGLAAWRVGKAHTTPKEG